MGLLLMQIARRETKYLINSLNKWPLEEVRLFISELVGFLMALPLKRIKWVE